jgi:hypothetical protein
MLLTLKDQKLVGDGLVGQHTPAAAFDRLRRGGKLALRVLDGAETLVHGLGEAAGHLGLVGAHGMPEQGMQDVPAAVEG